MNGAAPGERDAPDHVELPEAPASGAFAPWSEVLDRLAARAPDRERYTIHGEIARGGMGAILKAHDPTLRRSLAMKVMLGPASSGDAAPSRPTSADERTLGRFLEEAQVTGQLDHPGIVPVHELGVDAEGRVYFTMKLVKGDDLKAIFDRVFHGDREWTRIRALHVLLRVCEAMSYAHAKEVVHRDLKPANVMVGRFGEVFVMDWGLARVLGRPDTKDVRLRGDASSAMRTRIVSDRKKHAGGDPDSPLVTMDGDVVGTPAYMAPEQALGRVDEIGPHTDVFAVGAMLYHLLAGHMPYVDEGDRLSAHTVLALVVHGPPTPLSEVDRDLPAELIAICEKAMARKIADRYATMDELASDLRAFLENRVVRAYETGAWAELKKWIARNKAVTATAAAAVLLLGGLGAFTFERIRAERNVALEQQREAVAQRRAAQASMGEAIAQRDRADANAALAERQAADVLRLADAQRLEELLGEVDGLWPALPQRAAAMAAWLARARELTARLPQHEATLAELRTHGKAVAARYDFGGDAESQWWHDALARLVLGMHDLAAPDAKGRTIASVEARLDFAGKIEKWSIDYYRFEWDDAIASIADPAECPAYGGLRIREQVGLVPLGRDRDSGLWEFWHVQTGERPERDADGRLVIGDGTGLVFVLIPGGAARVGAQNHTATLPHYDPDAKDNESNSTGRPVEVRLAPFLLSKYEMTQGQWLRFTGANPSHFNPDAAVDVTLAHPVENVSFEECSHVLARLGLRLPSEAQWEVACRAGSTTPWWTGDAVASLQGAANLADMHCRDHGGPPHWTYEAELDDGHVHPAPVGSFRANPFGLHDVVGNLWEWCSDGFGSYEVDARPGDGEREIAGATDRVFRGSAWNNTAAFGRSARRERNAPVYLFNDLGCRPARVLD